MRLWQISFIYLLSILTIFIYKNEIIAWMQHDETSVFLVFLLALCFVLFPIIPYKIIIGMLGYMYGPLLGAFISWSAASAASVIIYLLARTYLQKPGSAYLSRFKKLDKLKEMMERNPFLAIFFARLIPFFPQSIVNLYPAFISVRLVTYAVASALGKIPAMLIFAFLGKNLFTNLHNTLIVVSIYLSFLAAAYIVYRLWLKDELTLEDT